MSGIYIQGMEMPESCWDCGIGGVEQMDRTSCPFFKMDYEEQKKHQDKRANGCPLVPVPDRGRLIDADALTAKFKEMGLGEHSLIERLFADGVYAMIDYATTIIPADKEGTA